MDDLADLFAEFRRRLPHRVYGHVHERDLQELEELIAVRLPDDYRCFIRECGVARATCDFLGYFPDQKKGLDRDLSMVESTQVLRRTIRTIATSEDRWDFAVGDDLWQHILRHQETLVSVSLDPMGGVTFIVPDPESSDHEMYYFSHMDREIVVDPECPVLSQFWSYLQLTLERSQIDVDPTILLDCWRPQNRDDVNAAPGP